MVGNPLAFLMTGRVGRRMIKEWRGSRVMHGKEYQKLEYKLTVKLRRRWEGVSLWEVVSSAYCLDFNWRALTWWRGFPSIEDRTPAFCRVGCTVEV